MEKGREESNAKNRREKRLQRRQTNRRRRRLAKVYNLLESCGLLPAASSNKKRTEALNKLDNELDNRYPQTNVLPYFLRARALDEKLEAHELGRALYHLSQRRGFLSNRKARTKETGGRQDRLQTEESISTPLG